MSKFKMTDEQKALLDALKPLQRKVALNVVAGLSNIDSYYEAGGKAKTKESAESTVSELLSNRKVKAFLDSMNEAAVSDAVVSRQEMLEELSIISRTNADDLIEWGYRDVEVVDKDGNTKVVKQSYWTLRPMEDIDPKHRKAIEEVSVGKDGLKFKRIGKLAAYKQIAEIAGYNAAQKHDLSSSDGTMSPNAGITIEANIDPKEAANLYREIMRDS